MKLHDSVTDILIVDDRPESLVALEACLGDLDHVNLIKAQSGREALELLPFHDFGVILMDVQMPELDGFETARLIRKVEKYKHTPIVFITAINKDDRYVYEGYEAGAIDYIFKPFDSNIVRFKVNIFVDLFVKNRQLQEQAEIIRKSEQQERLRRLAELEVESLKRYLSLADSIPHIVWKARSDGTFDYFNKVWSQYTGLDQNKSKISDWQSAIHPDDIDQFLKTWIYSMESGEAFEAECRIRRYDGEMRWHWVKAVPERIKIRVSSWIGTCTDIHDRKLSQLKLIEAEKTAVSASLAKTQFLANMSHEIRTPMSAILGFSELMLNPSQTAEDRTHCISTIHRCGRQLLKIIDEILDISKVESGHLRVEKAEISLPSFLNDFQSMMKVQAEDKALELKMELASPIPCKIFSDVSRVQQILTNIVGNAIKFTTEGSVTVKINHLERDSKNYLQIRVTDTGIGIDSTHTEKLFKPFGQVDTSTTRKYGGTGLGLALSRRLAQALGGDLKLESSEPNVGSTFLFEVDVGTLDKNLIADLDFLHSKKEALVNDAKEKVLENINVLVVDDSEENQSIISYFLKHVGAKVDVAANGIEGMEKALSQKYEVVLMDIQMPKLDGYEATSRLREQGYDRPIIALTAHALKEERDRCLQVGYTDHMTKPVDRNRLIQKISQLAKAQQNVH